MELEMAARPWEHVHACATPTRHRRPDALSGNISMGCAGIRSALIQNREAGHRRTRGEGRWRSSTRSHRVTTVGEQAGETN
jgi:hypothetical protein